MTTPTAETRDVELEYGVYVLADKANVHSPDNKESAGARLLVSCQDAANEFDTDALLEAVREYADGGAYAEDFDLNDLPSHISEDVHEIADGVVQIYTYQCWQEFADLCLWEEDLSELGDITGEDLTRDVAMRAEYLVASRLIPTLLAERAVLLFQANPVDPFPHTDAVNDIVHLEESKDSDELHVHLAQGHGINLREVAPGTDLDTLHRTLDHSEEDQ